MRSQVITTLRSVVLNYIAVSWLLFFGCEPTFGASPYIPAAPEVEEDYWKLAEGWEMTRTGTPDGKTFASVYVNGQLKWKSPPTSDYFALGDGPKIVEFDADGLANDALWTSGMAHNKCTNYGILVSRNQGEENYLIHIDRYSVPDAQVVLESSDELPELVKDNLVNYFKDDVCRSSGVYANRLANDHYRVLKYDEQAQMALKKTYASAMMLYKNKNLEGAIREFNKFFGSYDYRRIDENNRSQEFTTILNDYGFVLGEGYRYETAIPVLNYVISRSPARAVAYLNMADTIFNPSEKKRIEAKPFYVKYHDLMVAQGKKDKIPARVFERMK